MSQGPLSLDEPKELTIIGMVKGRVGRKMKVLEWCDFRVKCFQITTVRVFLIQGSKSVMRQEE